MDLTKIGFLTKELIKYKTARPQDLVCNEKSLIERDYFIKEINDCMNYIQKSLHPSLIIERAKEHVEDISCPIMIAKFQDNNEPDLLIIGHIDVVAAEESQFHPFEKEGKIYGRGAKDMKSGVAAMIEIMNYYAEKGAKPNIAIAVVSDEESGGLRGANLIVNGMGYRPKFVITPDPGEKHCIINKEKGFIWFTVTVVGRSGHPSRPWLADCAFSKAFKIWIDIDNKFNCALSEVDWKTSAVIIGIEKIFQNADGTFSSDNSRAIAGIVRLKIDIRYTENEDIEKIKLELNELVKRYGDNNKIEYDNIAPVCFTPEDNEFVKSFKHCADSIEEDNIPILPSAGASDLRYFSEKKIPCVNYGPKGGNHHAANEYVEVSSIAAFYNVITKYIDEYIINKQILSRKS
ncbi:MAG: M20/M25/M40 family metallo-hydrolase [Bacteroidota bacterium]